MHLRRKLISLLLTLTISIPGSVPAIAAEDGSIASSSGIETTSVSSASESGLLIDALSSEQDVQNEDAYASVEEATGFTDDIETLPADDTADTQMDTPLEVPAEIVPDNMDEEYIQELVENTQPNNVLTCSNTEQQRVKDGEDYDLSVELTAEDAFPNGASARVETIHGDELNADTESLNTYLYDKGLTINTVILPAWIGVVDIENNEIKDVGNVTVALSMKDISPIKDKFLYHLKQDGTWEQLEYAIYEYSDGSFLPFARFQAAGLSPFMFVDVKALPADEATSETNTENFMDSELEEKAKQMESDENSVAMPDFDDVAEVGDMKVHVSAPEGVFPEGASLHAEQYTEERFDDIQCDGEVAVQYALDIYIVDKEGNRIEPVGNDNVSVTFENKYVADDNLNVEVYHALEDEIVGLEVTTEGEAANIETDSFSPYIVRFTYNTLEYVLHDNSIVLLSEILDAVGLTGEVQEAQSSNEDAFTVTKDINEAYTLTVVQNFDNAETLTVKISDIDYVINVKQEIEQITIQGQKYGKMMPKVTCRNQSVLMLLTMMTA